MHDARGFRISVTVCSMLCIVCPLPVSTVTMLTPSNVLSTCLGDEVVINCDISENTTKTRISLRWEITRIDKSIPIIDLSLSDLNNNSYWRDYGLEFYAELTSYSPLRAILTTTADSALDGATVTCLSFGFSSIDTLIIRVTQIGNQ